MEDSGRLKVDEFLRIEGQENIFAIGDCCNSKDVKLGYTAGEQAKLVAANIKAILTGKQEKPWKSGINFLTLLGIKTLYNQILQ